jgi:hypothetical protein
LAFAASAPAAIGDFIGYVSSERATAIAGQIG